MTTFEIDYQHGYHEGRRCRNCSNGLTAPVLSYGGEVLGYQCGTCHFFLPVDWCPRCAKRVADPLAHCLKDCDEPTCATKVTVGTTKCPRHMGAHLTCPTCQIKFEVTVESAERGRLYCSVKCQKRRQRQSAAERERQRREKETT